MNVVLKDKDKRILNPKIPRYEKEVTTFTVEKTNELTFTNSYKIFPFDKTTNPNSRKFVLQSDGSVKIGKGVSKVLVSGSTSLAAVSEDQIRRLAVFKNDNIVNRTQFSLFTYQSFGLIPKVINVAENDIISMRISGSNSPSGTASCGTEVTYMTLQEV